MVFENDDQNPYEFIWFLKMMIRSPMNLYGVEMFFYIGVYKCLLVFISIMMVY